MKVKPKPIFDERGVEIHAGCVIRVFHFIGARKKKHYMYKLVSAHNGVLYALHIENLHPMESRGYLLASHVDSDRRIKGTRIVSCNCKDKDCA